MIGAVDIGGTKIAVGAVSHAGAIVRRAEFPTEPARGPDDAIQRISRILLDFERQAGIRFEGVGIGCTGPIDPLSGHIQDVALLPGWDGFPLVARLSKLMHTGVAMENDADAAALGEFRTCQSPGDFSLVLVSVGTGIGVGIVLKGRLYRGVDGAHPEAGHHVIDPSGPMCYCGARGCWESLASGPALGEWFTATMSGEGVAAASHTAFEVCAKARNGDATAQQAVRRHASLLGLGIANVMTIFAPDRIVLSGGLMSSGDLFLDGIRETVTKNCGLVPHRKTAIVLSTLVADAGLLGAAQVWFHRKPSYSEVATCL